WDTDQGRVGCGVGAGDPDGLESAAVDPAFRHPATRQRALRPRRGAEGVEGAVRPGGGVVFGVLPGAGPCSGRSSEGLGSGRAGEGVERSGAVVVFVTSRTGGGAEGVEGAVRPGGGVVFGVVPGAGP